MRKKQSLTIYLLKKGIKPINSLKEEQEPDDFKQVQEWKLLIKDVPPYKPGWATYLDVAVETSSSSAVLFIPNPNNSQWFALCFGYGSNLLNKDTVVDDFGLITALNLLDKDQIKSSDIFAPSDHSKQRRTQTSIGSTLQGHDMDGFSHILKNITGKSKKEYQELSKSISATYESIKINSDTTVEKLGNLCNEVFNIYEKDDCKNDFPEAFYIKSVKNSSLLEVLNTTLLDFLKKKDNAVFLEIPELIDYQDVDQFQISFKDRKKHSIEELEIDQFYSLLQDREVTLKKLKNWELILLDSNGNKKHIFSLIKCLVFDHEYENKEYHFSHGKWYCLDLDFSQQLKSINDDKTERIGEKIITPYQGSHEDEYNKRLAKELGGHLLDRKCIPMGGYDKIEPCDVLLTVAPNKTNTFVHVKIKHGGSSGLSHLFEQGDVSLTLLNNNDTTFISGIKEHVPTFKAENKKIIHFLIIGNTSRELPLFARVSLFKKINQIKSKGASVFWSVIDKS